LAQVGCATCVAQLKIRHNVVVTYDPFNDG